VRPIYWNSGVKYGDVNARWGSPSYLLEAGDPGYVADPTSASFPAYQPKSKGKHMPKQDVIKRGEREFSQQLIQFCGAVDQYGPTIGFTAAQIDQVKKDSTRYKWELDVRDICNSCSEQLTAWKNITRRGGNYPVTGAPVQMDWPSPEPPPVAPGVESRFRALVAQGSAHANFNPSIAAALGIDGELKTPPDYATLAPELKLLVTAAAVEVGWGWGGFSDFLDACYIEVDRGDGQGWRFLTSDTTPGYNDTFPKPATPQKWSYRAVYRVGDTAVGQWSAVVSVNVG
jgi:hypothetical protein